MEGMASPLPFDPHKQVTQHQVDSVLLDSRLQSVLGTGADFLNRVLYLSGEVDEALTHRFIASLHLMDSAPGVIRILVNSNGGSESDGFALYDAIRGTQNRVEMYGIGGVLSIASLVFQAGSARYLFPEAKMMIHNGSIGIEGDIDIDKLTIIARETAKATGRYHQIIAECSGHSLDEVRLACLEERHFTAQEAVKWGLADFIVTTLPPSEQLERQAKPRKKKTKK